MSKHVWWIVGIAVAVFIPLFPAKSGVTAANPSGKTTLLGMISGQ